MRKFAIAATLGAGLMIGALTAPQAKLPPAPPKSEADKAADAQKAAAAKAKEAEELGRAQDRAVTNYRKSKGLPEPKPSAAAKPGRK